MEVFIDLRMLAELLGVATDTARRFRYSAGSGPRWREPTGFPEPWGDILRPGTPGRRAPVFALSEVLDWLADNRSYDLRIALEFGNIGRELGRLEERQSLSPKASNPST